jgi:hypothetical protein
MEETNRGNVVTSDLYPSDSDLRDLAAAHVRLAAHGVLAGGDGYDLSVLAAAVYSGGWSYRIDRAVGALGFEAEVRLQDGTTHHRAMGWDPAVALAFALSSAFAARPTPVTPGQR